MLARAMYSFFEHITLPRYQIAALVTTTIIMLLMSLYPFDHFISLEPAPQLFSVTPKKLKEWGGSTTEVQVGLHITNFPEFDIVNNRFMFDGIIWFEFDPALISLETIEKFSFEKADIVKKTISDTRVIEDRVFVQYNIKVRFSTNLAFELFPLDDHRIFISLTNKFVSPSEMVFRSFVSGFTLSENIFIAGWQVYGRNVLTGYSEAQLDENDEHKAVLNPKVLFSIDLEREGIQQILVIFLPLFIMFFIGMFAFAFEGSKRYSLVLSLSLGSVTAMLSYRFVIQSMSPSVGYFLLSDYIFTMLLTFAFIAFLLNLILMQYRTYSPMIVVSRGMLFLLFHVMLIVCWYYLLYVWIKV